jgi:hypothetical protein
MSRLALLRWPILALAGLLLVAFSSVESWSFQLGGGMLIAIALISLGDLVGRWYRLGPVSRARFLTWFAFAVFAIALFSRWYPIGFGALGALAVFRLHETGLEAEEHGGRTKRLP